MLESWVKKKLVRDSFLWNLLKHSVNISRRIFALAPGELYLYIRRDILKNSIFIRDEQLPSASLFPVKILQEVVDWGRPGSVLDLGCGTGRSLDYFLLRGIDAIGVEGSKAAISRAVNLDRIIQYNLEKELNLRRNFDLIWSFEFVEHIHPKYTENLLRTFSNHSDRVVLSAAKPGQGGDGHFNLQPRSYWVDLFAKKGYRLNAEITEVLRGTGEKYCENMMVFERCLKDPG